MIVIRLFFIILSIYIISSQEYGNDYLNEKLSFYECKYKAINSTILNKEFNYDKLYSNYNLMRNELLADNDYIIDLLKYAITINKYIQSLEQNTISLRTAITMLDFNNNYGL